MRIRFIQFVLVLTVKQFLLQVGMEKSRSGELTARCSNKKVGTMGTDSISKKLSDILLTQNVTILEMSNEMLLSLFRKIPPIQFTTYDRLIA